MTFSSHRDRQFQVKFVFKLSVLGMAFIKKDDGTFMLFLPRGFFSCRALFEQSTARALTRAEL